MSITDLRRQRLKAFAAVALALATLYVVTGYVVARVRWIPSRTALANPPPLPRGAERVAGAIHVHTRRSHDARGTEQEVARAARVAGLDFVILSDHRDPLAPDSLWESSARYSEGVLIVRGQEISLGSDVGRVLAFGLDTAFSQWEGSLGAFGQLVQENGATAIVAHPRSPRIRDSWRPPSTPGIVGWEVFDLADVGRARLAGPWGAYHLLSLAAGTPFGRTDRSLLRLHREGFDQRAVAAFDSLYAGERMTALAGLDVHPKARIAGRLIPGYGPFFRSLLNHVEVAERLPPEPRAAALTLAAGLSAGGALISFGDAERARDFVWAVLPVGGDPVPTGGTVGWGPGMLLRAGFVGAAVERVLYRIVGDGMTRGWVRGGELTWPVSGPGAYRIEAYRYSFRVGSAFWNARPWIFSNPIRVTARDTIASPTNGLGASP